MLYNDTFPYKVTSKVEGGRIIVQLVSSLTGLELTKQENILYLRMDVLKLLNANHQTGDQLYSHSST